MKKLTDDEIESVRKLVDLTPELLEIAERYRAEKVALASTLARDEESETRTLVFKTPAHTSVGAQAEGGLRFASPVAVCVFLGSDGKWTETTAPTTTQINEATRSYLGGRLYEISEQEARELVEAGYSPQVRVGSGRGFHYEKWEPEKEGANA